MWISEHTLDYVMNLVIIDRGYFEKTVFPFFPKNGFSLEEIGKIGVT